MSTTKELGFSPEALKERYALEREKRLRAEGAGQYLEFSGVFSNFETDPYVEPGFAREPIEETVDVVIVGGGFGGLLAGARLRDAGVNDIRIIDKGADFGGTWYWNRYPGAACDVESYIYLPLLEETGYVPTEKYAKAPEIFAHVQRIGRHYDLYKAAIFQTDVEGVAWDEAAKLWRISTDRNDKLSARYVMLCGGVLHKPKLPGIDGIETFKGHSFHTCRWDYAYTGGSPTTPMDRLKDTRVGIIGTGATSVQAVPKLAEAVKALYVFQRTPSGVGVRANAVTDPTWVENLKPGWQAERRANFTSLTSGLQTDVDMVGDGWTEIMRHMERDPRSGAGGRGAPAGRLQGHGGHPRPRRRHREGQGHRRVAEALLQPDVQASLLPRRVSGELQPAQRPPGGHRRPGRAADQREGRGGRRGRV